MLIHVNKNNKFQDNRVVNVDKELKTTYRFL